MAKASQMIAAAFAERGSTSRAPPARPRTRARDCGGTGTGSALPDQRAREGSDTHRFNLAHCPPARVCGIAGAAVPMPAERTCTQRHGWVVERRKVRLNNTGLWLRVESSGV